MTGPRLFVWIFGVVIGLGPLGVCAENVVPVSSSSELILALDSAADGDVVELASGTYFAPANGFQINDSEVALTIRAAEGASVTLSGGTTEPIFQLVNAVLDLDHGIVFENLEFSDGFSSDPQIGGGVTLIESAATFSGCTFQNNVSTGALTGGGGVFMRDGAVAHFFDCEFSGNTAVKEGGAIRLRNGCKAVIHRCLFTDNHTDVPDHHEAASGGAVELYNSEVVITNSTFYQNVSGCFGGALYVKGTYDETPNPTSKVLIVNSTFEQNRAEPDATSSCTQPSVAGAMHLENDVVAEVYGSRFIENSAEMGGAFGNFRGSLQVEDSVFLGNLAFGVDGAGGALHSNSTDVADGSTDDGAINRPSAVISLNRCLFRGVWGQTVQSADKGACVYIRGDSNRTYGIGVPQDGTAVDNRAVLTVTDTAFVQCLAGYTTDGDGGAMALNHTEFDCQNCVFAGNDGGGDTGNGGAMRLTLESNAVISDSWFQDNQGGNRAAVFMVSGSDLSIDDSVFIDNLVRSGAKGSVLWSTPTLATSVVPALDVHGHIDSSFFIHSGGWDIAETDYAAGPVNAMTYSGDSFLTDPPGGSVFNSTLDPGGRDADGLNAFVASRDVGVGDTDKSPADDNVDLTTEPELARLLAVPSERLATAGPGDTTPTPAYLVAGWFGGPATLNGAALSGTAGWLVSPGISGTYDLDVGNGATDSATIFDGPIPTVDVGTSPEIISSGESSALQWNTVSGDWLDVSIDRGVTIPVPAAAGSVDVAPAATRRYRVLTITAQGGADAEVAVWVDETPPDFNTIFVNGFESGDFGAWSMVIGN